MGNAKKGLIAGISGIATGVVLSAALPFPVNLIAQGVAVAIGLTLQFLIGRRK